MPTQKALELDELAFEEAPDILAAMTLPELCRYVTDESAEDADIGFRTLLESPEALKSFRHPMH